MLRKVLVSAAVLGALAAAGPALAGNHYSSSGGSTSGWTPRHPSSSTTTTSTSSGTQVPEPGMIGLFGAGLVGIGAIQLRRRRLAKK